MSTREPVTRQSFKSAMAAIITSNTTTVGVVIDTSLYHSLGFLINVSAFTDGDYQTQIFHANNVGMSGEVVVPAEQIIIPPTPGDTAGVIPSLGAAIAAGAELLRFGILGQLAFVRVKVVSTNVTTGATLHATLFGEHKNQPQPNGA